MHTESNFKCSKTGKTFHITHWKSKIVNGTPKYYERKPGWYELVNPENGAILEKIDPPTINMTSIHTDTTVSG